tara:strand:- start:227 stop:436 length:210 start_codon:yes stop_codon:yes gene_type:complete
MTVLQAFDYAVKKKKIGPVTRKNYHIHIRLWERSILEKQLSDYGIVRMHPRILKLLNVENFFDWSETYI